MHKKPVYMDYMATTPVDPQVITKMMEYLGPEGEFGNAASSTHVYGKAAALAVDEARQKIADSIHANAGEIIFTSGATESNNLAIFGAARFHQRKGRHVITMQTEHKSVLDPYTQLESEGFKVTFLPPASDGLLNLSRLEEAITPDTIMVSIMHVNNETGVIQDVEAISELLQSKGIIFHVDAAQSAGKLPLNLENLSVDLLSLSAHKNYGPKGIGALYVKQKPRIRIKPLIFGGGHENGLRSGTLPTHQIVGMGEAFALSESLREGEQLRILKYRETIWNEICDLPGIQLNGHPAKRIAGNLNIGFSGIDGESLILALHELALSTKSACSSASTDTSYVLKAMGIEESIVKSSIRLSLGRFTTEKDVRYAIDVIRSQITRLRNISS